MNASVTVQKLLEEFMEERHALGYSYKTGEKTIRRFLSDYVAPKNGEIEFTKEYVLEHIQREPNQCNNTVLRKIEAINCFLKFAVRKGIPAFLITREYRPKENRNFKARIFTDDEIDRILAAADSYPFTKQSPYRHYQLPVMLRILINCGLRLSELLNLRVCDVDMEERIFTIKGTKFYKSRLVPFSDVVYEALSVYFSQIPPLKNDDSLFGSPRRTGGYTISGFHTIFHTILHNAKIPYGGRGKGPRPHDIRHTFAVHCLNNWVLTGEDLTAALPVLSRYLGHINIKGTQKYLQLTAQMYPDISAKMENKFGELIPELGVNHENI